MAFIIEQAVERKNSRGSISNQTSIPAPSSSSHLAEEEEEEEA